MARVLDRVRNGPQVAPELADLTEQELKLLGHIAEGLTNRQISERMFLAEKTVKNYVSALLHKLGLERRTQAAVLATRLLGPADDLRSKDLPGGVAFLCGRPGAARATLVMKKPPSQGVPDVDHRPQPVCRTDHP